jgi:hypothetical protein
MTTGWSGTGERRTWKSLMRASDYLTECPADFQQCFRIAGKSRGSAFIARPESLFKVD